MKIVWHTIPDFPEYEINRLGEIRRKSTGRVLKPFDDRRGYLRVSLNGCNVKVHLLVARMFVPNPHGYPVVDHKRGNKHDNRASQLEWCTIAENTRRAHALGLYNVAQIGKRVRILQTELGTQVDTYVTELTYKYDDVPSSKIIVANKSTDIASSVADMADRQRIEQAYAQGATQLYSQSLQANCDSQNGAVMDFYLPEDMRIVNKIVAKVRVGSFRAYSKATKAAESKVVSSTTASQKTYSSTSGGGSTSTTSSGGGQTSGATTLESSNVLPSQTSGQAVHNHGLSRGARLATTSDGKTIDGYETFVWSGAHVHPAHTHKIDDHSHSVRIPSHSHNVTIPGHSHNITIPAHEHDITPGIYFYGSPRQFDLYVNGKKKATIVSTDTELDLTQYLVDTSSKLIPRGSWLSIEIRPNDLAYVSIDMFVQGFVQSRGDATV